MSENLKVIARHMERLALQHNKGSDDSSSTQKSETDVEKLLNEFKNKMSLAETLSESTNHENAMDEGSESSDLDVDPSHAFSDMSSFALQLHDAARSTHLLAVNLRNWFQCRSPPEHYQVAQKIAEALCLRRLKAVVIECQAADRCARQSADAVTKEEKKRLRKLLDEAEDGLGSLGVVEMDLIEIMNICQAGEDDGGWSNSAYDDILEELVRIQQGGKGEKQEWMQGWTLLPGIG